METIVLVNALVQNLDIYRGVIPEKDINNLTFNILQMAADRDNLTPMASVISHCGEMAYKWSDIREYEWEGNPKLILAQRYIRVLEAWRSDRITPKEEIEAVIVHFLRF